MLPRRKPNRLKNYDYSRPNAYFITFCTDGRRNLLWNDVGASIARPQDVPLSSYGRIVDQAINDIPKHYPMITVDQYAVMPNHVHLLLQIHSDPEGRALPAPEISRVVQQVKGVITKQIGLGIWQKLFHDHVIRDQKEYDTVWRYIETNPLKWTDDCFYTE